MTTDATTVAVEAAQVTTAVRRRAGRRVPWRMIGSVGAGTALIAWHATAYGNWLIDDAGITFDYARSIATGLGPVVQAGSPPVEGYSNPAWLILLVVGHLLGLFDHGAIFGVPDYVLYPKALALLCCAGIVGAFYSAAAAVTRRAWLVTLAAS